MKTIKHKHYAKRMVRRIETPFIKKTLVECPECAGTDFAPLKREIGNEVVELCKCVKCGKESLCEWWESTDETTFNDCDEECKIK
jgi:Zn ribbon nucleic-acid-binding protein